MLFQSSQIWLETPQEKLEQFVLKRPTIIGLRIRPIFAHIKKELLNMNFNLLPFRLFWIIQVYPDFTAEDTTINIFVHKSLPTLVVTSLED